jgi:polysaccharide biosynthesis protein PslH
VRILLISRCPPYPLHLGDRLIVYHLAEELEGRKHQIDLLAFANRAEDWHEQDNYDYRFEHVQLIAEPRRSQLSYLKRAMFPPARFPKRAEESRSPEMWRAIEARLDSTHYDAIHLFGGVQVYEFYHALKGFPAVITPYESYSLYLRRLVGAGLRPAPTMIANYVQFQLARSFESWMFTPYRRIVVVSQQDKNELLGINSALSIDVIPNGIDLYTFRKARVSRKARALLFVGNYEYPPNIDAALRLAHEIFPKVQAQIPDVKLWLVGNAPPPELQALASESIKVTGRVPDVRPYLARAAAFVCPLQLGAGIKNKVLEALAIGCPVIATPLSMDGIDAQNGRDVLIADADTMAEAVVNLLKNPDLQRHLVENGRKLVEGHYSWSRTATLYENLYEEISR